MRRIPFVRLFLLYVPRQSVAFCARKLWTCNMWAKCGYAKDPAGTEKKKETKGPESRKRVKIDGTSFFTTQQPTHLRLRGLWQNQLSERVVHPRVHVLRTGPQKTKKRRHARLPTTGNMTAFHRPTHDRTHAHRKGRAKVALMQAGINRSAEPAACGDGQA